MAVVKCKECGKNVSGKADVCPHCGFKNPGEPTAIQLVQGFAALIALVAIVSALAFCGENEAEKEVRLKQEAERRAVYEKKANVPLADDFDFITNITPDPKTLNFLVKLVRASGYKCNYVNHAARRIAGYFVVGCDGSYWYRIEDMGGRWVVKYGS